MLDTLVVKVDTLLTRIDKNEKEIKKINTKITDFSQRIFILRTQNNDNENNYSKSQAETASKQYGEKLESELVDMPNRLRRNTIILHNVPEGAEGDEILRSFCCKFHMERNGCQRDRPR